MLASVDDDTLKNVVPLSVATALASSVLPVPGGPNMRTPRHGLRMPWKNCGVLVLLGVGGVVVGG